MEKSNTYCVMPHIGMAVQNYSDFCCCNVNKESWKNGKHEIMFVYKHQIKDAYKSYTRKMIATALDKGIEHPSCKFCWDFEKAEKTSPRQNFNSKFIDIKPLPDQPQVLIIKPGNTCNFACRMCNPATSTSWYSDAYELTDKEISFPEYTKQFETIRNSFNKNTSFWTQLETWIHKFLFIDIYGGEPFLTPAIFDLLEHAVNHGVSKNITLNIHTNCSIYNQKYLDILSNFKKVNFYISFDSHIHEQLSYIRHKINPELAFSNALKFIDFFKNFDNVWLSCTCTITPYNIYNIDEILFELEKIFNIKVSANIVTTDEFDIRHLPVPIKDFLKQKLQEQQIKMFLDQTIPGCDIYWPKFCEITDRLDKLRDQSFSTVFPEWFQILEPYWYKTI